MRNHRTVQAWGRRAGRALSRAAAAACALAAGAAGAGEPLRVVAASGDTAPAGPAGSTFSIFTAPAINNAGRVIFAGGLAGSEVTTGSDSGVWTATAPGALSALAVEGQSVPGQPAGTLYPELRTGLGRSTPALADNGAAFFPGASGTSYGPALYAGSSAAGVRMVARPGNNLPDGSGKWGSLKFSLSRTGQYTVESLQSSIWRGDATAGEPASLSLVARAGQTYGGVYAYRVSEGIFNSNGLLTFGAWTVPNANSPGARLYVDPAAGPVKILAQGDPAPGVEPPDTIKFAVYPPYIGRTGNQFLVSAVARSSPYLDGLWTGQASEAAGALSLVLAPGSPVPGGTAGATFSQFSGEALTPAGTMYIAAVDPGTGSNRYTGIWSGDLSAGAAGLRPFATTATTFPQLPGSPRLATVSRAVVNDAEQVAILCTLSDSSTLLAGYDPSLGLVPLVRTGDWVTLAAGDSRQLSSIGLTGNDTSYFDVLRGSANSGLPRPLNDLGELALLATFTDNSYAVLTARIPVAGDTNADGIVDSTDLRTFYGNLGQAGDRSQGDFNADGMVDFADFQLLERNFGRAPPSWAYPATPAMADPATVQASAGTVPEPGPGPAGALGLALLLARRRRVERAG